MDAFGRLQAIARPASTFCLIAAAVVFFGGLILVTIVLVQLGDGPPFGSPDPSLSQYAFVVLAYGTQVVMPSAILAVSGIALRLYAEVQEIQEERHEELLAARRAGTGDGSGDREGKD